MNLRSVPDAQPPASKTRKGLKYFFRTGVWQADFSSLRRTRRWLYQLLQAVLLVTEDFSRHLLLLRAAALTYSTVFSLVPLLALIFALLAGLGFQHRFEPLILQRVAAGSQEAVAFILGYISRIHTRSLGLLGLVMLVLSVVLLAGHVEIAFNSIWEITTPRPFLRKFAIYFSLTVIAPVLLLVALSATAGVKSLTLVMWLKSRPGLGPLVVFLLRLLPYLVICSMLVFLYMFVPNTRVAFKPALVSGLLAGTAWQFVQWLYVTFQIGSAGYNAIYGTFALVLGVLVWIFMSWIIVLAGADLAFALQHLHDFRRERRHGPLSFSSRQELSLAFLRAAEERFLAGQKPGTAAELGKQHRVPPRLAARVLDDLAVLGFLARLPQGAYLPAREFRHLPVTEVLEKLEAVAPGTALRPVEHGLLEKARQARRRALRGVMVGKAPKSRPNPPDT